MKKRVFAVLTTLFLLMTMTLHIYGHSGRTDASGGHKDNKNKSGLGGYHYHCGGYPAHLHSGGVCPYRGGGSSSTSTSISVPQKVYATRINVSNMPTSIRVGESVALKGAVYPSNAEDKDISWESNNTSVVTVDSYGNMVAVGVGNAVISAKTSRGTKSEFNITIKEVEAESIAVVGDKKEVLIGDSVRLEATILPANATNKDIEWKSEDESIALVDEYGVVTTKAVGIVKINAIHRELSDSIIVEVMPIQAEEINISWEESESKEEIRIEEGETAELSAIILPVDTTDTSIKWTSDNEEVALVDEQGKVTAVLSGTTIITAQTSNGVMDFIKIEVYKDSVVIDVIAGFIVFVIFASIIGGTAFIVVLAIKKIRKK